MRYIFLNVFDGGPYGHLGHFVLIGGAAAAQLQLWSRQGRHSCVSAFVSASWRRCEPPAASRRMTATAATTSSRARTYVSWGGMKLRVPRGSRHASGWSLATAVNVVVVGQSRARGSSWTRSTRASRRGKRRGSRAMKSSVFSPDRLVRAAAPRIGGQVELQKARVRAVAHNHQVESS